MKSKLSNPINIPIDERLRFGEERFRRLFEMSSDAIALLSKDGTRLYVTSSITKILGYAPTDNIGRDTLEKVHPDDHTTVKSMLSQVKKFPKETVTREYRIMDNQGKYHWLEGTMRNCLDDPVINAIIINYHDITERKLLENQKDEFLGIASHELKTPVASLKAFAQVLQNRFTKAGDTQSAALLGKMDQQIDKLTSLIKDLLDVSKIEGGRLKLNNSIFEFSELLSEIVEEVARTSQTHKIVVGEKVKIKIFADRERIGQVIINFLTNAIKYSPHKTNVTIKYWVEEKQLFLSVKDTGVGISKSDLPFVFDRFFRVSGQFYDTIPGMGLGLNIASEIIKRQGGKIWAKSKPSKGSTFYFSLPIINKSSIKNYHGQKSSKKNKDTSSR